MPSKMKKHSKSASKLSHSNETTPSPLSSSSFTPNQVSESSEDELLHNLKEVSSKYPSLIGTKAFIGQVIEDVGQGSKGCKIWLSASSMIASSITPGSIVSVSLASSRKECWSHSPLSSLVDECARHYGFDDKVVNEVGNYFALATVFPSCKVLKNGVRLSSSLSCSIGYPASGRIIFVYPINYHFTMGSVNGTDRLHSETTNFFSIHNCKDLYLALVSSRSGLTVDSYTPSHFEFFVESNHGQLENGTISSPKTPSFSQSKSSSPTSSQLTSPRYTKSVSNLNNPFQGTFDSFDIREVLGDESGKKLLQSCAASYLCSRHLLRGSLVVIPILSKLCIFQVVGANKISANRNIENLKEESNYDLFHSDPEIMNFVNDAFLVDHTTKVHLLSSLSAELETSEKTCLELESEDVRANVAVDFPKLGGLSKEFSILKDIIISSSVKGTLLSMGLRPTKGVLLHGPPGTGKTSLARACAHEAGVNLFSVNGPEIVSQYYGESEQALHNVFDSASRAAPAVVFIDELDAIAPSRTNGGEELSQRMVATLLNLMDGISRTDGLLVIAATNRPDNIEPALRRPGRLDREIEIGVPSPSQRYDILLALLREREHSLSDMEIQHLALTTHGFVGADLAALCNEAAFGCLRCCIDQISCDESLCNRASVLYDGHFDDKVKADGCSEDLTDLALGDNLESSASSISELPASSKILVGANVQGYKTENILSVSFKDFEKARMKVRPSAMREVILEVPKVSWEDVGGQEEVKVQLIEAVEWPQKHQDAFKRIGTRPPTGVLLFGPPGCSKTLLARAVASEAGLNFLAVKGPELFSKWVGESEKAVRSLFAKARANAPSIIFFDELDGLAVIRGKENDGVSVADRVMSQLLVELDGLQQRVNVTVIAATNRPDKIDSALLRPGRFDRLVYVGPPSENDRKEIFNVHLRKMPYSSDVCIEELALLSEGRTGADISLICREAAVAAIEERLDASEITMDHLRSAIKHVQPSEIESYEELSAKFQRLVFSATSRDELVSQSCSSRSSWISFRYLLKATALCFCLLAAAFSISRSSSS